MRLIQRYLFRQLRGPTIAATSALGAVAILSQSLSTLDLIVDQRQSSLVFLKIIALSLPSMVSMVLPIALFVAALIALNRLHTEQEIVVCFAGGVSRWGVAAPAFRLAAMATLLTLVINLWVAPWASRAVRDELFRVRTDLAASLVREGAFTQPAPGLTVYAQKVDQQGRLTNVFISQEKGAGGTSTFAAKRGRIVSRDGQPALVLREGSNQQFSPAQVLNYLQFDEYVFDLAPYLSTDTVVHYKIADRYMHELSFPDLTNPTDKHDRKKMLAEFNYRLASPLYNFTFMALALAGVLGGSFSRLGYARRIATVAGIAGVTRILGFGAQAACDATPWLNVLQYAIPLVPAYYALRSLFGEGRLPLMSLGGGGGGASADLQPIGA